MKSKSKQMLKGTETLTGQKKLFYQSAGLAVTAYTARKRVCAWREGTSLPCQGQRLHGKKFGSSPGTDCLVSILSGSWWRMAPPAYVAPGVSQECSTSDKVHQDGFVLGKQLFDRQKQS